MGIQDFDPKVQSSINRIQSYELVSNLIDKTKAYGFNSINFDLIYGLPKQTEQSIEDTIEKVKKLKPEMIAFYSYAHLPSSLKNQKLINEDELPKGDEKRKLYEKGRDLLFQAGYLEIGLDHFTLKDSYLGRAFEQKRLKRNFMGYTDKKSNCLLGLGVSSISNNNDYFIQSEKEIKDYYSSIDRNLLPIFKGHTLTVDDQIVSDIIQELMCNLTVNIQGLQSASYFKQVEAELEALEIDGLIKYENYSVDVTSLGQVYLRNIALVFDSYLRERESSVIFSQSI
jgi:oxygen-independent coproporphyrinogen III oxidase